MTKLTKKHHNLQTEKLAEMAEQELLSRLSLDFCKDDWHTNLFAVSLKLTEMFTNNGANFQLEQILKERRIIDDKRSKDSEKDNCYPVAAKGSMVTIEDKLLGTNRMS